MLSAYHLVVSWWRIGRTGFVDLPIFLDRARNFLETGELYLATVDAATYAPAAPVYKFPPLFGMLLLPFARDGVDMADFRVHWILQLLAYALAVGFAVWLFLGNKNKLVAALGLVLALNFEPFVETLWRLQVETPLLLLLLLAFAGMRWKRPELTGSAIGIAAMLKVYPGFLVLYFLFRRRWNVVTWAGLSAALVTVATLVVIGPDQHRLFFFEILPLLSGEPVLIDSGNVSLARHLQESGILPAAAKSIQVAIGLVLMAVSAVAVHRAGRRNEDETLGLCLFIALMLVVMPNSWVNYQVLLLPVLLVLLRDSFESLAHRAKMLAALAAAYLPMTFYQPCRAPTVSWPCAQTPFYLGLVQLPRGFHDAMVDLRVISAPILWACVLVLILLRRQQR